MKRFLCRILIALAVIVPTAGVASVQPAAADHEYKVWDAWVGGMYHNWFVRVEQFDGGGMLLRGWRFSYADPYNWNNAVLELHTSADSYVCWRILGGSRDVQPARFQVVPNELYSGQNCDAAAYLEPHPVLGYCGGKDAAFTINGGYMGYEAGYYCPYDYPRGTIAYGPWVILDTTYDPRFTSGYHTFRAH